MKLRAILFGLLAMTVLAGCKEETPEPVLHINKTAMNVPAEGGSFKVEVTSNISWTSEADAAWVTAITPSQGPGADGPLTVEVSVDENTAAQERSATVTFSAGSLTRQMTVNQEAKEDTGTPGEEEDETGNDSDLLVAWAFSTDMKSLNEKTWHQKSNDTEAGFSDRYLTATIGSGKITYHQESKYAFEINKVYRYSGKKGEPMFYGSWTGDYYLFEADCNLAASSNASISFGIWGKNTSMKYWMLEYKDGDSWKVLGETEAIGDIVYNVICGTEANPTLVNETAVLKNGTDKVSFRLTCVGNISVADNILSKPANDAYIRIDPNYPVIIKGSAISEGDRAGIIAPALTLDKSSVEATAEAASAQFSITSNMNWSASSDAAWVNVFPMNGNASEAATSASLSIDANNTTETRSATVSVSAVYGNATITKTIAVTQAGKTAGQPEPEPDPEPSTALNVTWEWNTNQYSEADNPQTPQEQEIYNARKASWHQDDTDTAAGDAGKFMNATSGTGKLSFVQNDKSPFASATIRRHLGKNAEPVVYGAWEGDYFLFEASDETTYPAGTKVAVSFGVYGNNNAVKTWKLEYLDGSTWKTAVETVDFKTSSQTVEANVTTSAANSGFQFRLVCTGKTKIKDGSAMDAPGGNQRISPSVPITIKVVK